MKEVTSRRRLPARISIGFGLGMLALFVLGVRVLGGVVLAFAGPGNDLVRGAVVSAFCLISAGGLVALFIRRWRRQALGVLAMLWTALIVLWTSIEPTNERDWQPDVAVLPYADISGDQVTRHNIL